MTIIQAGALNPTSANVPDLYIQVVPPQIANLNGVASNIIGVVGSASWGPVNSPVPVSDMASYQDNFGGVFARKYDMGTILATACLQFASSFQCVRVSDGSDTAAAGYVGSTGTGGGTVASLVAKYTGSRGNAISWVITPGAIPGTYRFSCSLPGQRAEVYDNLSKGAQSVNVATHGHGYVYTPTVTFSDPDAASIQKERAEGVAVVGCMQHTVIDGGNGFHVGDALDLGDLGTVEVATVGTGGAILTITTTNPPADSVAAPFPQSIAVDGATIGLTWGVTSVQITKPGKGYTGAPNIVFTGGIPAGSGGVQATATVVVGLGRVLANAINEGLAGQRGPSDILVAASGTGHGTISTTSPPAYLSGGTDGADGVAPIHLIGSDLDDRSGMYALRGTGANIGVLSDVTDKTTWPTQQTFGAQTGIYMILTGPAGESIAQAGADKSTLGIFDSAVKVMLGDWIYWLDNYTGTTRLVSPQGFVAGRLGALSPEQSGLNKRVNGVIGTQKSTANRVYGPAELNALGSKSIDVICSPVPGGSYYGIRFGRNASLDQPIWGDNYSRLTPYIVRTLNAGAGAYVGDLQSGDRQREAKASLDNFLDAMKTAGQISDFSVQLDSRNNPPGNVARGIMRADVKVQYGAVIEQFLIAMEAGQGVQVTKISTTYV